MFDFWTNSQYGTSRIEIAGTMQYDPAVWKYEGKFSIDQLPSDQFPFPMMDGHYMFDIVSLTDKAVKCKSESGLTFYVPKSALFTKAGKINLTKFYHAARLNSERWFNQKRGLSK